MKKKNNIKKLSLKYRYLILEKEEVKSKLIQYQSDWLAYIYTLEQEHGIAIFKKRKEKLEIPEENVPDEGVTEDTEIKVDMKRDRKQDPIVKDIYNKIAVVTHPDKTENDSVLSSIFREATKAKNRNDLISMISICGDLDIDVPELEDEHIRIIEVNISTIQNQINGIKKTDPYVWAEADKTGRENIEKNILRVFKK